MKKIILLSFPITLTLYILLFTGNINFSEEIEINSNINRVVELFDNPYNMKKYINSLSNYKLIIGETAQEGAIAEISFINGENNIIIVEETIINNLPEIKQVKYSSEKVLNIVTSKFIEISANKTVLIIEHSFEFYGFKKIMAFFSEPELKNQNKLYLKNFKKFVEESTFF